MCHAGKTDSLVCDDVIVGCGVAGLYTALNLPCDHAIVMLSKSSLGECNSMLAQGGISVLRDEEDYPAFFDDTMSSGHYENRAENVETMIRSSREVVDDLMSYGVEFNRMDDGSLAYAREGAHSCARICYHDDITGREVTSKLLAAARQRSNITIMEHVKMLDLLKSCSGESCIGVVCCDKRLTERGGGETSVDGGFFHSLPSESEHSFHFGKKLIIRARNTIFATGGIGGLYRRSTNYPVMTGDGCRVAAAHGVALEHMDYVQTHPTALCTQDGERAFLISESCRGAGAILLDDEGNRFCDELQSRDKVCDAIIRHMRRTRVDRVWLSFENVDAGEVTSHFRTIYARCLQEGYDLLKEPVPVAPAQHYFMGGIRVDSHSQTTLPRLYAVGETSCTGVHGKNRLASNSLLEALVFAVRAARRIASSDFGYRSESTERVRCTREGCVWTR